MRRTLFDWVGSQECLYCKKVVLDFSERTLCKICLEKIRRLDQLAHLIHLKKQYFSEAVSVAVYEGPWMELIHQWKFSHMQDVFHVFADHLRETTLPQFSYDWILPVPLHPFRLLRRGFNPSGMLAMELSQTHHFPVGNFLKRRWGKKPQVGLSAELRVENIKDQFFLPQRHQKKLKKSRCLLVDDVLTTGSTVNECARVLKGSGISSVDVLTLARAL